MPVTFTKFGAVVKATIQGETLPGGMYKALFWYLDTATENTHKLRLVESSTGELIYADAAPKTDGTVAIPTPDLPVDGILIEDMDNGYIFGYPKDREPKP